MPDGERPILGEVPGHVLATCLLIQTPMTPITKVNLHMT